MRCRISLPLATLVAAATLVLIPDTATAAPAPTGLSPKGKRFRFNLGTDVFSLVHFNPDGGGDDSRNRLGFGIGRRTELDWPTGGIGGGVTSLGFGYIFPKVPIVLGAQFAFAIDGVDVSDDGGTTVEGRLVPYFNYMFNASGRFTPFVGLHFGLGGGLYTIEDDIDPIGPVRATTNVIYPVVGPQGGVHIFIVDAVSVDALMNLDYMAPHGRTVIDSDDVDSDRDYDKLGDLLNVAFISVGISAWF